GNDYRSDDAVGLIIARQIANDESVDFKVYQHSGEGSSLMEYWKGADTVILADAVSSGSQPGKIYRLVAHAQPMPANFFNYSTHAFSVAEAIELSRVLGELPAIFI